MYRKYFSYLFRHKWYVFLECLKYNLVWQGIVHDFSKFFPDELIPYALFFYGGDTRKDRFYTPDQGTYEFNVAWLKHQNRNPHHWQYWVLQKDNGRVMTLEMPDKCRKEMLCDWKGAGKAQGRDDVLEWYTKNKDKMELGKETRNWIEKEIGYV